MIWWRNLNQRERMLVSLGVPVLMVIMFYLYLWQPVAEDIDRLRIKVPENNATLAWMHHQLSSFDES
ncbi:MAG: type II secretion system protein GspM, partial [Arenicellales bacterium]